MNEFKFQITTFLLVAILAFGGYWAFTSLDRGVTYQKSDTIAQLTNNDQELPDEEPVVTIIDEADTDTQEPQGESDTDAEADTEASQEPELSAELQSLNGRLENLIRDDIFMRDGSRGTRVGTVQEFLNLYLDTQSTVDNQYGPGTISRVRQFQEDQGLSADGLAGPATYEAMIDVLPSL